MDKKEIEGRPFPQIGDTGPGSGPQSSRQEEGQAGSVPPLSSQRQTQGDSGPTLRSTSPQGQPGSGPSLPEMERMTLDDDVGVVSEQRVPVTSGQTQGPTPSSEQEPTVAQGVSPQQYMEDLRQLLPMVAFADQESIRDYQDLAGLRFDVDQLPTTTRITFRSLVRGFRAAVQSRVTQLGDSSGPTQEPPPPAQPQTAQSGAEPMEISEQPRQKDITQVPGVISQAVRYVGMVQFHGELLRRRAQATQLVGAAKTQYSNFNAAFQVASPVVPAQGLNYNFLGYSLSRDQLGSDHFDLLLKQHNPRENVLGKTVRNQPQQVKAVAWRMPVFHPDFHLPCTVLLFKLRPCLFDLFKGAHYESAVRLNEELPQASRKTITQLEAKFAFSQDVRYICLVLDEFTNSFFNECVGFYLANGLWPDEVTTSKPKYARCTGPRCATSLVAQGNVWYFYCQTEEILTNTYIRLLTKISPVLSQGTSFTFLVRPDPALPIRYEYLPAPNVYEHLIPVVNMWTTLSYNFLSEGYRSRFSPCLFAGGCFLPIMAHDRHAVHGRTILSMPTFAAKSGLGVEPENFYRWHATSSRWLQVSQEDVLSCAFYSEYMRDPARIFGSWHFHTCYERVSTNAVVLQPGSWNGAVVKGFDPSNPSFTDDSFILQVLLQHVSKRPEARKAAFLELLNDESSRRPEWALRYRRLTSILQGSSGEPYVSWVPRGQPGSLFNMKFVFDQPMGAYEMAHMPNAALTKYYAGLPRGDWSGLSLVPKELAPCYDPVTDSYNQYNYDRSFRKRMGRPPPPPPAMGPSALLTQLHATWSRRDDPKLPKDSASKRKKA